LGNNINIEKIIDFIEGDKKVVFKVNVTNPKLIPQKPDIKKVNHNRKRLKKKHIKEAERKNLETRPRKTDNDIDTYKQRMTVKNVDCELLWKELLKYYEIVEDVQYFLLKKPEKLNQSPKHVLVINFQKKTRGEFDYDENGEDKFFSNMNFKTSYSAETIKEIEAKIVKRIRWGVVTCFRNVDNSTINCMMVNYK